MHQVSEEHVMLRELVKKFVRNELMPLEKNILDRFAAGQPAALSDEENRKLFKQCKELGLWALDVPEEAGGANLPAVAMVGVNEELGYTAVPFTFPPDSPNLHMMLATVTPEQRKKYLEPYAAGETTSAIAISEPGAGGDPAGMKTRAVKDGDHWLINGRKIWISRIAKADFTIAMAVTDPEKGSRGGSTAFLVDKGPPGLVGARAIPMLAEVANKEKMMPQHFITEDGFGITAACRRYLAPLIRGEDYPPYKDGLPAYVSLKNQRVTKKLTTEFVLK
jgi:acyl-CoA dehydrogenase